jgi:hypothetical protein
MASDVLRAFRFYLELLRLAIVSAIDNGVHVTMPANDLIDEGFFSSR